MNKLNENNMATELAVSLEDGFRSMGLDPEVMIEWCLNYGYFYLDEHLNIVPTDDSIGLDPENIIDWCLDNEILYLDEHSNILPTDDSLVEELFYATTLKPRAINSECHISDNGDLFFGGPEGHVTFNLDEAVDLNDIWHQLGAPEGNTPKMWIQEKGIQSMLEGTTTKEGDYTMAIVYLTSIIKDGLLVDYVTRIFLRPLVDRVFQPGWFLLN